MALLIVLCHDFAARCLWSHMSALGRLWPWVLFRDRYGLGLFADAGLSDAASSCKPIVPFLPGQRSACRGEAERGDGFGFGWLRAGVPNGFLHFVATVLQRRIKSMLDCDVCSVRSQTKA